MSADSVLIMVGAVAILVVGTALGWVLGRRGRGRKQSTSSLNGDTLGSPTPAKSEDHTEQDTIRQLRRDLRSEQSLLDGVAAANGVTAREFRKSLATEYLHAADPYRWHHLQDVVDVTEGSDVERSDLEGDPNETGRPVDGLEHQLALKQAELDKTRLAIAELRSRVETILEQRSRQLPAMPGEVIDLREEVAELRSRMADRAVEADRLRVAADRGTTAHDDYDEIVDHLTVLRKRVLELRPQDQAH